MKWISNLFFQGGQTMGIQANTTTFQFSSNENVVQKNQAMKRQLKQ